MRVSYAHSYVRQQLGMDPHTVVQVQGKQPSTLRWDEFDLHL